VRRRFGRKVGDLKAAEGGRVCLITCGGRTRRFQLEGLRESRGGGGGGGGGPGLHPRTRRKSFNASRKTLKECAHTKESSRIIYSRIWGVGGYLKRGPQKGVEKRG